MTIQKEIKGFPINLTLKDPFSPMKPVGIGFGSFLDLREKLWVFVRNMCMTLRTPGAPQKPLPSAYSNFLARQTKFYESPEMTHNIRGKNYTLNYIMAPIFAAIFLPNLFLQKCLGNRGK